MNENEVLNLKFGESVRTENGDKYTRTIGGWIYSTFAGNICFIPEVENEKVVNVMKKQKAEK